VVDDADGFVLDVLEAGAVVEVVVAVLVVVLVAVLVEELAGAIVDVVVAVDVEAWLPFIIRSSLWQPPSVIINAAAQTTTDTRMLHFLP
jgi:hypothetical protein